MSNAAAASPPSIPAPERRPLLPLALIGGVIWGAAFTAFGQLATFNGEVRDDDALVSWLFEAVVVAVVALAVWRLTRGSQDKPRSQARQALILGALSALSLPGFWLGIYAPFAAAALVLGISALRGRGEPSSTKAMAAAGIALAAVGAVTCSMSNLFG